MYRKQGPKRFFFSLFFSPVFTFWRNIRQMKTQRKKKVEWKYFNGLATQIVLLVYFS